MMYKISENEDVCANCKYFRQHYIKESFGYGFIACNAGHCVYPRMKNRSPGDTCKNFGTKNRKKEIIRSY